MQKLHHCRRKLHFIVLRLNRVSSFIMMLVSVCSIAFIVNIQNGKHVSTKNNDAKREKKSTQKIQDKKTFGYGLLGKWTEVEKWQKKTILYRKIEFPLLILAVHCAAFRK